MPPIMAIETSCHRTIAKPNAYGVGFQSIVKNRGDQLEVRWGDLRAPGLWILIQPEVAFWSKPWKTILYEFTKPLPGTPLQLLVVGLVSQFYQRENLIVGSCSTIRCTVVHSLCPHPESAKTVDIFPSTQQTFSIYWQFHRKPPAAST